MKNERMPLYQQVQDYIKELIHTSGLKEGDRIPTEKELMELFNVSKITVVNALAGLVNEGSISRVPGRGSFVNKVKLDPSEGVSFALRSPDEREAGPGRKLVGIVMPSIEDYFSIRLIEGIQNVLRERGYQSVIQLSDGVLEQEKQAIKLFKDFGVDGLLIFPVDEEQYNEEILSMKLNGFPFVLIDRFLPGVETDYIASDGRIGTQLAVDYLWELGHREIAICSDSPLQTITVQERIDGYMFALKNKGALINPAHMITEFSLKTSDDMQAHPLFRYVKNRMATAYITLNGKLGAHVHQMAVQAGLNVPEDLSIITFDDSTAIMEGVTAFTHVKQFEHEIGHKAAELLLGRISAGDEPRSKYSKILIKPELIVRHSTGPCKPV
ncbi:GntR family transcriptional regulator [Paenibacillus harenae]|uniref:GntR family transcriptional regulator of arabinose operon n=1 Tax=Paenibacillus harenae TaxID=306543 RepID=A0ABT9TXY4_PAEHA|nr:substrate-binding domain-containing protein [Paenibacillus harenae]MDQ0112228.1 GntR family transcriptional regulator of arabinose operon [Paenibacillus harenae]